MPIQPAFPALRDAMKKKVTRREQFLAEMNAVVPWGRLLALIALPGRPEIPPSSGEARADASDLRRRERASGRQGHHAALGHLG